MKNLIWFLVFFGYVSCGFSQTTRTIVKNFRAQTNNVELLFDCEKEIKYWDNDLVQVVIDINVDVVGKEHILETLIKLGRYTMEKEEFSETLYISLPKLKNDIYVQGNLINEYFNVIMYLPKHMSYKTVELSL